MGVWLSGASYWPGLANAEFCTLAREPSFSLAFWTSAIEGWLSTLASLDLLLVTVIGSLEALFGTTSFRWLSTLLCSSPKFA